MWAALRFNEKELSHHATSMSPDKEGLLEKKGAVRGQGYKQRWFRLKGNLLFYFRVDELLGWEVRSCCNIIKHIHYHNNYNNNRMMTITQTLSYHIPCKHRTCNIHTMSTNS
jgi:hypothetical protein